MAFVVSEGQLTNVERPMPLPAPRVQVAAGLSQDYATIWRTQPNVRTVVDFLARNIAQLGLHTFRRVSDVDRQRLTDHPLAVLLGKPNGHTTRYRLIDALVHDLGIYDVAAWLKVQVDGGTTGLLRLPPDMLSPLGDSWIAPAGFRLQGSRGYRDFPADQVVFFRGYNPGDSRWGCSPIETLRRVLAEEYAAGVYRDQLWRNGARFPGYIERPKDAADWSPKARQRFREDWQAQYTGDGPQAGGTPILEDGMKFVQASITPEQAQYLEARKLTREEVAAAYHIPLPMVGILDHATFSNITEQHKQLYQDTLGPWLQMIQEEIALQLLPDVGDSAGVYVEFNLAEKLKGSFEEQAAQLQTAVGAPWLTRNEARARANLPQIAGGDALVTPLNVVAGGQASPTDSAPKRAPGGGVQFKARAPKTYVDKATEVLGAFFDRQSRVLLSQLGAAKAAGKAGLADLWDDERWNAELAADLFSVNALVAEAAARKAMEILGLDPEQYDVDRTLAWLQANASGVAEGINGRTKTEVAAAIEADDPTSAVRDLFAGVVAARAAQIAVTQVTALSGFGVTEAARQSGHTAAKTWRTTASKPRASHARMDGETVPMGELFSNGARWPGDSTLDDDERAGCTCELDITVED